METPTWQDIHFVPVNTMLLPKWW